KEPDDEGTEHVHEQRAPGEGLAESTRREARAPIARNAAERAAERDPTVEYRGIGHQPPALTLQHDPSPHPQGESRSGKTKPALRRACGLNTPPPIRSGGGALHPSR